MADQPLPPSSASDTMSRRCGVCGMTEHQLFGTIWRCSECGGISHVNAADLGKHPELLDVPVIGPPSSASGASDEPLRTFDGHDWKHNCLTDVLRIGRMEYPRLTWIAALERLGRQCGISAPVIPSTASPEPHPDFGPCDGFGTDGGCSECGHLTAASTGPGEDAETAKLLDVLAEDFEGAAAKVREYPQTHELRMQQARRLRALAENLRSHSDARAPEGTEQEEPFYGPLGGEDVNEIRRNRTTGPTYNFFAPTEGDTDD